MRDARRDVVILLRSSLIVASLIALSACSPPQMATPAVSDSERLQEARVQQQMATAAELEKKEKGQETQLKLQERLNRVFAPVARAGAQICTALYPDAGPDRCVFEAEVAKEHERELNAWADGRKIYVTPAMENFARSDDELALVLSHELAHDILRHPQSTAVNAITGAVAGTLVDLLAASRGVDTGGAFGNIGEEAGALHYSTTFESEADYVGMYILANAGYDYRSVAPFWRRMSTRDPDAIYIRTTHPTNPERFVAIEKTAIEIERKQAQKLALLPETLTH
jgi:predicted Zn-dependent protease